MLQHKKVVKEYNNVDEKMFESYLMQHLPLAYIQRKPGSTQDMYAEPDKRITGSDHRQRC